jgi:RimJ/RimL family protein N-acetyltransferase
MTLPAKVIQRLGRQPQLKWLDIISRDLSQPIRPYPARLPYRFEILPADLQVIEKRLKQIPEMHKSDLEDRISNNHICCTAEYQGLVVFVSWIARGVCYSYLLDRQIELAEDEAYLYSAYTVPEFRGNGIHPSATTRRLNYLKQEGFLQAYAFVEPYNSAAQRMPGKVGYKKIGITGFLELAGFRWYFHKDGGKFSALTKRNYWRKV